MQVIPQEFESIVQTSKRFQGGRNCPPIEVWKMVASLDKLQTRPYIEAQPVVKQLLASASKGYQTALESAYNRTKFRQEDTTRLFLKATETVQKAFNEYCSKKDLTVTNTNATPIPTDVLTTADEVHKFLAPYFGDISNQVPRPVRFVEKSESQPVIYNTGIGSGNVRPAQFGNGWEAWFSFVERPDTIWIIGRTGNAFNSNKDIVNFIRQYFPNVSYLNNTIAFAREIARLMSLRNNQSTFPQNVGGMGQGNFTGAVGAGTTGGSPIGANGGSPSQISSTLQGGMLGDDLAGAQPGVNIALAPDTKTFGVKKNSIAEYSNPIYSDDFIKTITSTKGDNRVIIRATLKAMIRVIVEIIAITGVHSVILSFDILITAFKLLDGLILKLRMAIINHDIAMDPIKEKTALYQIEQFKNTVDMYNDELYDFSDNKFGRIKERFQKWAQGVRAALSRYKDYVEKDILNDDSMFDPMGGAGYGPYSKSIVPSKAYAAKFNLAASVNSMLHNLRLFAIKAFNYLTNPNVIVLTAKVLLSVMVNIAKVLNQLIGIGLDIIDNSLSSKQTLTDVEKLVKYIEDIDPSMIIDRDTVEYLKQIYDPILEKLKDIWNNPKQVLSDVMNHYTNNNVQKPNDPANIRQNGFPGSNVYHAGGTVTTSRRGNPWEDSIAERNRKSSVASYNKDSIMDTNPDEILRGQPTLESDKLYDTNMTGNSGGNYGYEPSPIVTGYN